MKELYDRIRHLDMNRENELLTVTGGEYAGLHVLFTDREPVWAGRDDFEELTKQIDPGYIFKERLTQSTRLVVCGCGFVGQAVITLGRFLGWHVTALDDRSEYAQKAQDLGAEMVIEGSFGSSIESLESDGGTCFVVVTREHQYDRDCLDQIMKKSFGYAGMMGSHKRAAMMKKNLIESGVPQEQVDQLYTPVGLSIGAQSPEEIAVSIIAQIMQVRAQAQNGSSIPDTVMDSLKELHENGGHAIMAVVTAKKGSGPREPGTRMIVYPDGRTAGTIGGGLMEAEVIEKAVRFLEDPSSFRPCTVTIDLSGKKGEPAGMLCGGITDVFLELL